MENVEIVVEDSGRAGLLGHYHGVPLTERGSSYAGYLPDRITIYRRALEARARTPEDLAEQVRVTVWHEVAHHFGIDDDRLHELGMD
jgi:predicted Zn-dependent protease with MMP-like domain